MGSLIRAANKPRMNVAPKPMKGGSKTQSGCFWYKSGFLSKKDCYEVTLCKYCQWRSSEAFITGLLK